MSFTGRGVIVKKDTVDDARSIDILDLQRNGFFGSSSAATWTCEWKRGEDVTASIGYRLERDADGPSAVWFWYSVAERDGEKTQYDYPIRLEFTLCHFGGRRWWFVCPLVVNGRACGRRCRIVYLAPGAVYFGCRECYQLTYESRQRHRDRFYEGFTRPMKMLERAKKKRARSPEALVRNWQQIATAHAAVEQFGASLRARTQRTRTKGRR